MPHVETLRTIDPEQKIAYHRRTPNQGTGRLSTWKVMYKSTVDTVNHRLLIPKLYNTTQDSKHCRVIENLLSNKRLYVELNNERSRLIKQKNGMSQGIVLAPTLFNIYTIDQPIHNETRSLIYEDDDLAKKLQKY